MQVRSLGTAAFPRDAVIRRVNAEPAIMFGAGRALLLQIAHPNVAAGVADHSDFQSNPFKRLLGTLEAVYTMVYGSAELADGVGRRVRRIHDFITSDTYRANDPENLLWVHATLLDSALRSYERIVGPLPPDELETYYEEMATIAVRFGCPRSAQPADYAEFERYWDEQVRSIEVTDVGRRLAREILEPRLPLELHRPLAPLLALQRLVAVGTTPEPLRAQLGYPWDESQQDRLDRVFERARRVTAVVPRSVRIAPGHLNGHAVLLPQARRHVRAFDRKMAAA